MAETTATTTDQAEDAVTISAAELVKLREAGKQLESIERDTAASFVDRELALALNDHSLVDGVSGQLLKLIRDGFKATRSDGRWVVSATDGQPVGDAVRAMLGGKEFSHFIRANARPGTGSGAGGQASVPTNLPVPGRQFATLGDEIIAMNQDRRIGGPALFGKYDRKS